MFLIEELKEVSLIRRFKHIVLRTLIPFYVIAAIGSSVLAEIDTVQISQRTLAGMGSCLKWKLIGECFWLHCDLLGCSVRVSPKIGHFRPDLVVSVYPSIESQPWREVRTIVRTAFNQLKPTLPDEFRRVVVGSAQEPGHSHVRRTRNLRFLESDAFGHPLSDIPIRYGNFFCSSEASPLIPYYSSLLDIVAWRNPEFESTNLATFIPGRREVGNWPLFTWGSVYPRCGWVDQPSPPKAAAVIAQRAADITVNGGMLRVRTRLNNPPRIELRWGPPDLHETDEHTGKWQMLHPQPQSSCEVFGSNDLVSLTDWGGGKVDAKNTYVWALWRPYQCCRKAGQIFLGADDIHAYP